MVAKQVPMVNPSYLIMVDDANMLQLLWVLGSEVCPYFRDLA